MVEPQKVQWRFFSGVKVQFSNYDHPDRRKKLKKKDSLNKRKMVLSSP
jgi:hypothetical protein